MALRPQRQANGQVEPIRKRLARLGVDPSIGAEPQTPAARAPIERTQTEIAAESAKPAKRAKHGIPIMRPCQVDGTATKPVLKVKQMNVTKGIASPGKGWYESVSGFRYQGF
jgi:hypothetical protein